MTSPPTDTPHAPLARAVSAAHSHVTYRARALPRITDATIDPHQVLMSRVWHDWDHRWTGAYGTGHVTLFHHQWHDQWAVVFSDLSPGWKWRTPDERRALLVENTRVAPVADTLAGLLEASAAPFVKDAEFAARRLAVAYALTRSGIPEATTIATMLALGSHEDLDDQLAAELARKADLVLFSRFTTAYSTRFHHALAALPGPMRTRVCSTAAPNGCWACNQALSLAFVRHDEPDLDIWWDPTVQTPVADFEALIDADFEVGLDEGHNPNHPHLWTLRTALSAVAASYRDPTIGFWEATATLMGPGWVLTEQVNRTDEQGRPARMALWADQHGNAAVTESALFDAAITAWADGDVSDRLNLLAEWSGPHWTTTIDQAHARVALFKNNHPD